MQYDLSGIRGTMLAAQGRGVCRPTEVSEQKTKPDRSLAIKTGHLDKLRTGKAKTGG
jgi:hypothetical protein